MKIIYNSDLYAYIENNKKFLIKCLEDNEEKINDQNIENIADDYLTDEYFNLLSCLKEYENKNNFDYLLIDGVLGLWYGKRKVKAQFNNFEEVLNTCCCHDSYMIYFDSVKNTMKIDSYHHDGCNSFKIYVVKNNKKYAIKLNDLLACY